MEDSSVSSACQVPVPVQAAVLTFVRASMSATSLKLKLHHSVVAASDDAANRPVTTAAAVASLIDFMLFFLFLLVPPGAGGHNAPFGPVAVLTIQKNGFGVKQDFCAIR